MTDTNFDYTVGDATIDEETKTATVPVTVTIPDVGDEDLPFGMVVEDGTWKIDTIEGPSDLPSPSGATDFPTGLPTDLPSDYFSDFPTDFPTDPSDLESYLSDYFSDFSTYFTP
jgi:hypothetical protein